MKWFWIKNVQKWETFTLWGQTRLWLFRVRLNHNVSKYVDLTKFLMLAYFFRWLLWIEIQDYESWRLGFCLVVGDWCAKTITGSKFANFKNKMHSVENPKIYSQSFSSKISWNQLFYKRIFCNLTNYFQMRVCKFLVFPHCDILDLKFCLSCSKHNCLLTFNFLRER